MLPRDFQRTQIPNEMATLRGLKPSPTGKFEFLVITHVLFYKMPSWPEQEAFVSHTHTHKKPTKWCTTCDKAKGDFKVVGCRRNDGSRIQSAEIRVMYYDISVRNSGTETSHLPRISLEMSGMCAGEENVISYKEKMGRRGNPSLKICASCRKT